MKEIQSFRWYLPPKPWDGPKAKPYLSSWSMDAATARRHGALYPDPFTRTVIQVPETPEEAAKLRWGTDTSHLGGPAPGSPSDRKGKR